MDSTLLGILENIDASASEEDTALYYRVMPIPHSENHYFGRTNLSYPCLLLKSFDSFLISPIKLAGIEVNFALPCTISLVGRPQETETLTAITCTSSDETLRTYFAHVCETILEIVGPSPSLDQVAEAVRRLVDLFQRLSAPSKRSLVGLFGELYVISNSNSPITAVTAWRSASDDRFDFSIDDVRLEVKSSSVRRRVHELSHEQCCPPKGTHGVLISLFVETSGGGTSLLGLIERIERQLNGNANLLMKLQEIVAESLGNSASTALVTRFDESLARSSLQAYELPTIPAIRNHIPPEVTAIRFRSDLSRVPVTDIATLASRNERLRDLLPSRA